VARRQIEFSKRKVFERRRPGGGIASNPAENISQNSFLITASQKACGAACRIQHFLPIKNTPDLKGLFRRKR
jgi:hypothetical protein